jgi:cupin superfamily acireductone dioxygenase involved in methionine salvage
MRMLPQSMFYRARDFEDIARSVRAATAARLKHSPSDLNCRKRRALHAKSLDKHTHAEDEMRIFVEGSGMFRDGELR